MFRLVIAIKKIAIVGSRKFGKLTDVDWYLTSLEENSFEIITGGAPGVDTQAMQWCARNNVKCTVIRPVDKTDKFSYLLRNVEIITLADEVVAFWDGTSKGTQFVINYCKSRNKKITVLSDESLSTPH